MALMTKMIGMTMRMTTKTTTAMMMMKMLTTTTTMMMWVICQAPGLTEEEDEMRVHLNRVVDKLNEKTGSGRSILSPNFTQMF
jgi:hypothetical protein